MSTISVTNIVSPDANTPLIIKSANTNGGQIVLNAANTDIQFLGNLRLTSTVSGDGSGLTVPSANVANAAYVVANSGYVVANASYTFGNTVYAAVNSAFAVINASFGSVNTVGGYANTAGSLANQAGVIANAAFGHSNLTYGAVNSAFGVINASFGVANAEETYKRDHIPKSVSFIFLIQIIVLAVRAV